MGRSFELVDNDDHENENGHDHEEDYKYEDEDEYEDEGEDEFSSPETEKEKNKSELKSHIDAERFIPAQKKQQWNKVPKQILVCFPSHQATHLNALAKWVYLPEGRRSDIDLSTFNIIQYVYPEAFRGSLFQRQSLKFDPRSLHGKNAPTQQITHAFQRITNNRNVITELKNKLDAFCKLKPEEKDLSLETIREELLSCRNTFSATRIIATEPEKVARICDQIQTLVEGVDKDKDVDEETKSQGNDFQSALEMAECHKTVCLDYLTKLNMVMDVERLQTFDDLSHYDLYSCKFDSVEFPPPLRPIPSCPACVRRRGHGNVTNDSGSGSGNYSGALCGYHSNLELAEGYRNFDSFPILESRPKASMVSTILQFDCLQRNIEKLTLALPSPSPSPHAPSSSVGSRFIAYISVPGVAENRPAVSIGDLVRLRFVDELEVVGEVSAVDIQKERIMLFLPLPNSEGKYLNAMMHPKNEAYVRQKQGSGSGSGSSGMNRPADFARFDVRFATSSRAHGVFKLAMNYAFSKSMEQIKRIIAPSLFIRGIKKKHQRSSQTDFDCAWLQNLNTQQKTAVQDILDSNHSSAPYIIYGPPGTGKTMVICEAIAQILQQHAHKRVLVCAPSDAACDIIATRLLTLMHTSSNKMPSLGQRKIMRVNWFSRNPSSLPPVLSTCTPIDDSGFFKLPDKGDLVSVQCIICRCFVAGMLDINADENPWIDNVDYVFVDESCQSYEFEVLTPLLKVGRNCSIVLTGDPKQLGPTVRSISAGRSGLSLSLQERLMGLRLYQSEIESSDWCVITRLVDNYRSHIALLRVPSQLFYDGTLRYKGCDKLTGACQNFEMLPNGRTFPLMMYNVEGTEMSKIDTPSFYNKQECNAVLRIINALLSSPNIKIHSGEIAVITCFRAQVLCMRQILRQNGLGSINVGVVEDFQGQETSVVIISTVLTKNQDRWKSGPKGGLGFMTDPRRFNVALTRASSLCVIVGNSSFLEISGSYWTALIEHIRRNSGISGEYSSSRKQNFDDGIFDFIQQLENLNLLGKGHELDRYEMAMQGYYQDSPEWKVCL